MLTCDHDEDIAFLVSHAKRALRVIRQNVILALATKFAFLVSAVFGAAPLWLAVVADTGATVAVTLNGLRLLAPQRWLFRAPQDRVCCPHDLACLARRRR